MDELNEQLRAAMPFGAFLGMELTAASAEEVRARIDFDERLCTTGGILHGGVLMGLADATGGFCAFLNLPDGATGTATIESKTNFFAPVREGHVEAVSRPLHKGRTTIVVETDLFDAAERRVARVTQTQAILPPDEFMRGFMRLNVKPGVELPPRPPGDPPPWMAKRPGGIRAFMQTFATYELDRDALARFDRPVYYALGGLSNPDQFEAIAARLGRVFPNFELEVFEARHHFDPPHRIEPERLAESLTALWGRADRV